MHGGGKSDAYTMAYNVIDNNKTINSFISAKQNEKMIEKCLRLKHYLQELFMFFLSLVTLESNISILMTRWNKRFIKMN